MITLCHRNIEISLAIPEYDWVLWASYIEPSPHEDVKLHNGDTHKYDKGNGEAREYHKILEVDPIPWLIKLE